MDRNPVRSILIINPNTTQAMTDALKPLVDHLDLDSVSCHTIRPSKPTHTENMRVRP